MITLIDKHTCTGCCACMNVCRKQGITMESDQEGFWYPKIDAAACENCHLCEHVCPLLNGNAVSTERLEHPQVLAAGNTNRTIRLESTSGGRFLRAGRPRVQRWRLRWRRRPGTAAFRLDGGGVLLVRRYKD